jgi:hypothetical protein
VEGYGSDVMSWENRLEALLTVTMIAAMLSACSAQFTPPPPNDDVLEAYPLLFPVAGENSYVDMFGAPRSADRTHQGTDIFANKLTPVVGRSQWGHRLSDGLGCRRAG